VVNPPIPEVEITKGSRRKKDGCRECRQDRSNHACGMLILASVGLPTFALARGSRRKRERRGGNRTDAKMSPGSSRQVCHNASSVPQRSNDERTAAKTAIVTSRRFGFGPIGHAKLGVAPTLDRRIPTAIEVLRIGCACGGGLHFSTAQSVLEGTTRYRARGHCVPRLFGHRGLARRRRAEAPAHQG
jgi:hypothetical protein